MNFAVRMFLGITQMPDKTINDLDQHLPGFEQLANLAKQAEPIITRNAVHLKAMEPDMPAFIAILKQAWPVLVDVTPTTQELIDFAKKD